MIIYSHKRRIAFNLSHVYMNVSGDWSARDWSLDALSGENSIDRLSD